MKIENRKSDLHKVIDNIDDEELLEEIHYIIKSSIEGVNENEWNELPVDVKEGIMEGLSQSDLGQGISHEAFKKKFNKWFSK